MKTLKAFLKDQDGMSATEYVVLFLLIMSAIVAGASFMGPRITDAFNRAANQIP